MVNNKYNDKAGRYPIKSVTLETVDQAVYDYFDKRLAVTVEDKNDRKKVPIIFATGERWKLIRDKKGLRDVNGTLILPIITIRRSQIDRTRGFGGLGQEVSSITVSTKTHPKTDLFEKAATQRRISGFPQPKIPEVQEYFTIPYPDFCTVFYEITIWTQYQTQMNEVLEKIFYNYDHADSFVMPVEYDGKNRKGNSYYFVGFRENISPKTNVEEFTDQERIIQYSYSIKTPVYLMLDPKDETLAYGRERSETSKDDGSKVVYKSQNAVEVKLSETVITLEEFRKLFG